MQRNNPRALWMSTVIKQTLAARIVAQDVRPISHERRDHHRTTIAANDEVKSKPDISARFLILLQAMSAR